MHLTLQYDGPLDDAINQECTFESQIRLFTRLLSYVAPNAQNKQNCWHFQVKVSSIKVRVPVRAIGKGRGHTKSVICCFSDVIFSQSADKGDPESKHLPYFSVHTML